MGWFAILFVAGFLLFWGWRGWPTWNERPRYAVVNAGIVLFFALVAIACWYAWTHSLAFLLDRIGQAYGARVLLGLGLGIATAYVVEQRAIVRAAQLAALARGAHVRHPAPVAPQVAGEQANGDGILGMSLNGLLGIGLVVVFFAIAAPHLDGWLRRMTSLKLPFGELQVASVSTHAVIKSDSIDLLADATSLAVLSNYDERIQQDLEYLREFELPDLVETKSRNLANKNATQKTIDEKQETLKAGNELLPVFSGLISPIAKCIGEAIDNGLAIDDVREKVRPMARALEHILYAEDKKDLDVEDKKILDAEYAKSHQIFWDKLKGLPKEVGQFLEGKRRKECLDLSMGYETGSTKNFLPEIRNYKKMPYLYVAAILFTSFVRDDEVALKIVREKRRQEMFKDYGILAISGTLAYVHSRDFGAGLAMFETMRDTARKHREVLRDRLSHCEKIKCDAAMNKLISQNFKRERAAVAKATNNLVYYAASDLAQGGKAGERYLARLEGLAEELKLSVDQNDDDENKYFYLDTYAYTAIVLEARKKEPIIDKIKNRIEDLEKVVEYLETSISNNSKVDRNDISQLNAARAHLASARELAGQ